MDGLPTIQSRIKRKANFKYVFAKCKKEKTKREMSVVIFIFQTKHKWGAVTFFSISIQKVGFLPTYQENLNPKTQSCTSGANHVGEPFCFQNLPFFFSFV